MKHLNELLNLGGKSAIVTGAAKGIGYGIAYRLAEAGAKVVVADNDGSGAKEAADKLVAAGFTARASTTDVADEEAVEAMITACVSAYGGVDIMVNNAGIYPPMPLATMSAEDFERVMHVNLRSVFLTTKYVTMPMKSQGGGTIINITSIDALHPSMIGLAHYDASKHGLWGFTKNSALELAADNIRVNAIAPGGVATPGVAAMNTGPSTPEAQAAVQAFIDRIPMRRMGEPDDIGTVALFLASDMSAYMTGSQIVVDGGVLLR